LEKRLVQVTIQGKTFSLRAEDEAELLEIVAMAEERLDEVAGAAALSQHQVALLTVLTLAEELYRERKALAALRERIRLKSSLILDMLDPAGRPDAGDSPPDGGMGL
jgi:cell division protein ZapA (FtsZ GTPase activity inhibitor)